MNISSIFQNLPVIGQATFQFVKDQIVHPLFLQQKKVVAIVLIIFTCLTATFFAGRAFATEGLSTKNEQVSAKNVENWNWKLNEDALKCYFELLEEHPELKGIEEGNQKKDTYQIILDKKEIRKFQHCAYEKLLKEGYSPEVAAQASRVGIVFGGNKGDKYWYILRDLVKAPSGITHTYNRLIQKSQLNGFVGAIVMPVIKLPNGETKISLVLNHRHAIREFVLELPRGGSLPKETPKETATRELREETGYIVEELIDLGQVPPDSGVIGSKVPVFFGIVTREESTEIEDTEAIKGKFLFSIEEINEALKNKDENGNSYLEVMIEGEKKRYLLADPFLVYALYHYNLLSKK